MSKFFKGYWGAKWILGCNLEFLLRELSKNIFGNNGSFSREHGNTDPPGGLLKVDHSDLEAMEFNKLWCLINKPLLLFLIFISIFHTSIVLEIKAIFQTLLIGLVYCLQPPIYSDFP